MVTECENPLAELSIMSGPTVSNCPWWGESEDRALLVAVYVPC